MQPTFVFRKPKDCTLLIIPPSKKPVIPPSTIGTIVLRLTVNGKRATKSTGIQVAYADWDAKGQKIRGKSDLVRAYTARLTDLLADANRHYFDLERAKLPVTPNRLRKLIAGEESQADETLL
jgi:hypothetical protein